MAKSLGGASRELTAGSHMPWNNNVEPVVSRRHSPEGETTIADAKLGIILYRHDYLLSYCKVAGRHKKCLAA